MKFEALKNNFNKKAGEIFRLKVNSYLIISFFSTKTLSFPRSTVSF